MMVGIKKEMEKPRKRKQQKDTKSSDRTQKKPFRIDKYMIFHPGIIDQCAHNKRH